MPRSSRNMQESPSPTRYQPQAQAMSYPFISGPEMDRTINDSLYLRYTKWKARCEMILECELAGMPEQAKCKKVISWSGDHGLDQYISWNLQPDEHLLTEIWKRFEDFCKPQANELRAHFDLLTRMKQGHKTG